ncbi:MAG: sodium:solute symporter [Acidobacteriota bacterium]|nr:MAG: sodium:solute symporter [Acidobacteriota bacterium]
MNSFETLDWLVVAAYFAAIGGIAWWVMRQRTKDAADYFLASRHVGWYVIGASIFASNIGSEHIVGLASTGADSGVALGHYELHSWCVLLLGWVFVPFYLRSRVFTMPEFLELRYTPKARWFLSVISLIAYVLTKVSVTVYAGAVVFETLMGIEFWTGALIVVTVTGLYTALGGLRAVVYTDTMHSAVLLIGSLTVAGVGLAKIGGWGNVIETVGPEKLNMFPPMDSDFPWLGLLLASPIVGIWYWCTDQCIVQRTLAAKDEQNARRGAIWAAYLKLFPFFIFMIPGIIAAALRMKGQLEFEVSDQVFPTMVKTLLPVGIRGLVAGGLLAALMSSLAAVFNGCSTLFTMDIYKKLRPNASEESLVHIGRIATIVVVALGILWIPILRGFSSSLYQYLQNVQAYIAPPITAVFLLGLFWRRINGTGAIVALVGGFILGMSKLIAEVFKDGLTGILGWYAEVNFLYFAPLLFLFSVILMIVFSLMTKEPSAEQLKGLTYSTTMAEDRLKSRASWGKAELVHTVIILAIIGSVMIYFSPWGVGG